MVDRVLKARSLWPLPGGSGHFLDTLRWVLQQVHETTDTETIERRMTERYGLTSRTTARKYLAVPHTLGLIDLSTTLVFLEESGQRYLDDPRPALIREILFDRVDGCDHLVDILGARPLRIGPIFEQMRERGYTSWTTASQVRYRLRWLEEVGVIERSAGRRPFYRLVPGGTG